MLGKMSDLDLCIREMRNAAQSMNAVADALTTMFSGDDSESIARPHPEPPTPTPKPITLEQVRTVLAEKSRSGHTARVRELLEKHGASRLSEIAPEKYGSLLADAMRIGVTEEFADG